MSIEALFTPEEIGLPKKFDQWRPNQWEGITQTVSDMDDQRFVVVCAPVGSGKSPWYISVALLLGLRVCIITSTKLLQKQLMDDFSCIGLLDVKGRNNYDCLMAATLTCEDGSHARCVYSSSHGQHSGSCPYRAQLDRARKSQLVVTNYSYWMSINKYSEGIGEFDLLIIDEAHEAPQEVTSMMSITLSGREVYRMLNSRWPEGADDCSISTWRDWARVQLPRAQHEAERVKESIALRGGVASEDMIRESRRWQSLLNKLTTLAGAEGAWASEPKRNTGGDEMGYLLEPLWPSQYAERLLFCGIPHVLLMSATINHKTLHMLGVSKDTYILREYPYIFPIQRSPVIWIPTASIGYDSPDADYDAIRSRMEEIVTRRTDRKGVIHSTSYKLRDWIKDECSFGMWCITHDRNSQSTELNVRRFRDSGPPSILVSPSVDTGYDFLYQDAEYQIIPKLPFPVVKGSRIMEARCIKKKGGDPGYRDYLMIMRLVQACGRIMRAPDDQGETFIIDDNMRWVWNSRRMDFPAWFRRLYRRSITMPEPPAALLPRPRTQPPASTEPAPDWEVDSDGVGGGLINIDTDTET